MFRLAWKTTLARKLRLLSTSFAVILGVAFLAGTLVFTDTIERTFDDLFADIYERTDAVVRSETSIEGEMGWEMRGRMPSSTLATVRGVDGVARADGIVQGFAQIVGSDGNAIGRPGNGPPTFGQNYQAGELSPWKMVPGGRAPRLGEVVIDKASADKGDLAVGDTVTVLTQTGPHQLTLVGTVRFGSADSPGGASVSLFNLATAHQVLAGEPGQLDMVMVAADEGISEEEITARIAAALPDGTEALTGTDITKETQDDLQQMLSFFDTFLLAFAAIGLVVACFTIYNTFQIVVSQRRREMAMLRTVGATRRQVLAAQLLEAVFLGVVASVLGIAAGVLVAAALRGMLEAFGVDIPASGLELTARTALVALAVGVLVTVVSAVSPSVRASRVPPLAALREVASGTVKWPRRRLLGGIVLTGIGVAALIAGLAASAVLWVGAGALVIFVGVFVLGPVIAHPVVRVLGAPVSAVSGVTGSLARENALRNPKRTARTGGALMVGVALVVAITVMSASVKDWVRDVFDDQFTGDFVVATQGAGFGGLSPQLARDLNELPEVASAAGVRAGVAQVRQRDTIDTMYVSIDPATTGRVFDVGMVEGSIEALTPTGVLLDDDEAADRHLTVGDTLELVFLDGRARELTVEGIYTEDALAGPLVISHALNEQSGTEQLDVSVYIAKAPGVSDAAARDAIAHISDAYPNAEVQSRVEFIDSQAASLDQIVNLMYGLLALAVIIALFSIANSVALSIHERTHELGLLRAVGMTRQQTRTTVRWEAALIALLGTGLGVVIGIFFGWSISVAIRDGGLGSFSLPVIPVLVIVVLAVLGGVLAALRPARRAARLDVLQAIATE
jgi:putative ABC transport system permease protein